MNSRLTMAGRLAVVIALGWMSGACATIMTGTTQDLAVETDPAGAACKVERQGATVGMIKSTPGKTNIPKHRDNIEVACNLPGYETSKEVLASSFTGATFGNIIAGGFVGVVIDASSGANNKYPDKVIMTLTPSIFANEYARDTYFAGVSQQLRTTADAEIQRLRARCGSSESCELQIKQVEQGREKGLAEIENKRLASRIGPVA